MLRNKLELRSSWLGRFCGHGPLNLPPAVGAPTLLHPSAVHVNRGQAKETQLGEMVPACQDFTAGSASGTTGNYVFSTLL